MVAMSPGDAARFTPRQSSPFDGLPHKEWVPAVNNVARTGSIYGSTMGNQPEAVVGLVSIDALLIAALLPDEKAGGR
jgi:hypothetical protein